ncbi:quinoprotein relay system zinc metallohydrolase 2 [Massilia sp.]|uniref:quinoprotein relay system zinc metallohydrolase 2 n=1 Tax=Massilia sp. TaxID=1882437 RepID=UPI0028AAF6EA|nr:quinoprotein relay system zinc metallohydrolase 2 [Massilia sp.]
MRGLILAAWLLACACVQAGAAPLQVDQIAPGVWVHVGQHKDLEDGYDGDVANIGFVVGQEAVAVIDTGGSYAVGMALREAIRRITRLPIRYVINTHVHPDHVFGNAAFVEADPAAPPRLVGHAMLPQAMRARSATYARNLARTFGAQAGQSRLIPPDQTVARRLTLDLGGRKLELRAWPRAHTDNDLSVFDVASGTLWTGDLLFVERTPSIDGDVAGWLSASEELARLPAARTVPGHGPVIRDKNRALARQRDYLTVLLRDVRASIRGGGDMAAAMETAAASERARWQLFDAVNPRNVSAVYPALEWE